MDNNFMNVDLPQVGLPAPRNLLDDHNLPHVDDSDIPVGHTMELERLTLTLDCYSKRYILITCFVGILLAVCAGIFIPIATSTYVERTGAQMTDEVVSTMAQLIAGTLLIVMLICGLFNLYLYMTLVSQTSYVLEMERVVPGRYSTPQWIEDNGDDEWYRAAPIQTASSLLSIWRARVANVVFANGAHISTPLGSGTRRDEVIERSGLGPLLFKMDCSTTHYEPVSFLLDDQLPSELMIPKIHQLGIDPQLLATRVNQAANSIDLTAPSNGDRKSALIQARTVSGAADPWSMTVAAVTADVQSKTRVADGISAFLTAQ